MTDKKKSLVGLAEQLIGVADAGRGSTAGYSSDASASLTDQMSGQVEELMGLAGGDSASAPKSDSGTAEDLAGAGKGLTSGMDQLTGQLIRGADTAIERTDDLVGRDVGELAEDVGDESEFTSKWDWRREAAERAEG